MVMLQYALQPAAPMLRDRATYDSRVAQRSAERVAFLASMLDETFDRDTSQTVSGTEASANIWKQRAEFTKLASELKAKAEAATATAKTGEEAQVKAALRGVTGACTACHDKFRSE